MRTKSQPTHILTIEIPLNENAIKSVNYDAVQQALKLALAVSVAAYDNVICDEILVELLEAPPATSS